MKQTLLILSLLVLITSCSQSKPDLSTPQKATENQIQSIQVSNNKEANKHFQNGMRQFQNSEFEAAKADLIKAKELDPSLTPQIDSMLQVIDSAINM